MLKSLSRSAIVMLVLSLASRIDAHDRDQPFLNHGVEVGAPRGFTEMCLSDRTFCSDADTQLTPPARVENASLVTSALATTTSALAAATGLVTEAVPAGGTPAFNQSVFEQPAPARHKRRWRHEDFSASPDQAATLLQRINRYVNERVAQRTDEQLYGRPEVWHRSGVGRNAAGDCEDIAIEKRFELIEAGFPADRLTFAVVYARQVGLHAVLVARTSTGDYVLDSRSPYINRWDRTAYSFVTVQSAREPMRWFAPGDAPLETAAAAPQPVAG